MESELTSFLEEASHLDSFSPVFSSMHVWRCLERWIQHCRQSLLGCYDNTFSFLSPSDPLTFRVLCCMCHASATSSIKIWKDVSKLRFAVSHTGRKFSRKLVLRLGLLWKIRDSYECSTSTGCLSLLVLGFYWVNLETRIKEVASSFWQSKTFYFFKGSI